MARVTCCQLLVSGYAEHNFGQNPDYEQRSDAHSLLGLEWRLIVTLWRSQPNQVLHYSLVIEFEDEGEEKAITIYSAKVKLSVLLTNGQLVSESEDRVRHRFGATKLEFFGEELNDLVGQQQQLLSDSFIVRADIEVHGEPTILSSPNFHHAIQISPVEDKPNERYSFISVAGYQEHLRRLVFWMFRGPKVTCWAVNPLVPSSLEELCSQETEPIHDAAMNFAAALSKDQCLAACAIRDKHHIYHFYVLHLGTKELVHRMFDERNTDDDELNADEGELNADEDEPNADDHEPNVDEAELSVVGLAHTRWGWITWFVGGQGFYLLTEHNQIRLVLRLEETVSMGSSLAANYNVLLESDVDNDRFQVWDLGSAESHLYDHHEISKEHNFFGCGNEIFVREFPEDRIRTSYILSKIEFGKNQVKVQPCCRFLSFYDVDFIVFDGEKLILVASFGSPFVAVVETLWMPGHIPTAKQMATMEIQKQTGRQEMRETAVGYKSVWKGGVTEDKIREILKILYKSTGPAIMD